MCGIAGMFGPVFDRQALERMVLRQAHRGPDAQGLYEDPSGIAGLGHNRLSIIDLSPAGRQPMASHDRRYWIVLNGEVYNYRELRAELSGYPFRTQSDTEVILAAYERWGEACLDRFLGMFAFLLWDERERRLFGARDRFGVKPLHYAEVSGGALCFSSEIKALHAAGVPAERDPAAWATYLTEGLSDYGERTFWKGVRSVPAGHKLTWSSGTLRIAPWYSLAERAAVELDGRPDSVVAEEYGALLRDSVALRFRSDVPVAVNLSGGLDSATLLGLVHAVQGADSRIQAFTFVTGDPSYDELPWVEQMLRRTKHPSIVCRLSAEDVPALAESVAEHEDEPFGGIPTLAYARLFEIARREGVVVLLDGQGMDEQWAGYDYYRSADAERVSTVQGVSGSPLRPECLTPEFRAGATPVSIPRPFPDALRNLQYRDIAFTKIPRALRFNDRVSMRSSTELREPFLDHRLLELALRQPADRKIRDGQSKWLVRKLTHTLLPDGVREAPKRPLQTPQREWLRGPLRSWAEDQIERALAELGGSWLDSAAVRSAWRRYAERGDDNSFYVWQWISLGMSLRTSTTAIA
jgi:asparagine synthase (glutamine-hydrolysing)